MLEYILASGIGSLCGAVAMYAVAKKLTSDDAILEKIDVITTEILTNEDFQRKIYSIGALIGSGITSGAGLQRKGGKYGLQDLIMQVASEWFTKKQQQPGGSVFGSSS